MFHSFEIMGCLSLAQFCESRLRPSEAAVEAYQRVGCPVGVFFSKQEEQSYGYGR